MVYILKAHMLWKLFFVSLQYNIGLQLAEQIFWNNWKIIGTKSMQLNLSFIQDL